MQPKTVRWTAICAIPLVLSIAGPLGAQQVPAPPGDTALQGITPTGELINKAAAEITDRHVFSNDGEDLGEVERVVVGQADNVPHAVIEVGGFLGFGATPVAIPFDLLRLQGDDIYITRNFDEGQLKAQFPYSDGRYRTVPENQIIADVIGAGAAGQAPGQQATAPFEAFDLNRDGYITMSEAAGDEQLSYNWREIDRNNDGLIDAPEFSAFEQPGSAPAPDSGVAAPPGGTSPNPQRQPATEPPAGPGG
jgi:sporulation protein YlmC with PRC-barrel domain